MKLIFETFDQEATNFSPKNKGLINLFRKLEELERLRKNWHKLPTTKKLPQNGFRLVSLRSNPEGQTLTIFVANHAISSKFKNNLPSLIKDLNSESITQINIKIKDFSNSLENK